MQHHSEGIEPAAGPTTEPLLSRSRRLVKGVGLPALLHGLFVALVAAIAVMGPAALQDRVEGRLLDWRFQARDAYWRFRDPIAGWRERAIRDKRVSVAPPAVVIVAIDDRSVAMYGSWPWPRSLVDMLIERIGSGSPKALGVNLPLHDSVSPEDDMRVAEKPATLSAKTAIAAKFPLGPPFRGPVPGRVLAGAMTRADPPARLLPPEASLALLPAGSIARAAVLGHAMYVADSAGKMRHENLYLRYGDALIPSIALQTARIAVGVPPEAVNVRNDGGVELDGQVVPADRRGRMLVNYYGAEGSFQRFSAAAVLSGETSPSEFEDDVVFLGGTADIAAVDFVNTPFAENLPAIEKDATVAANILAGDFLREAPPAADLLVVLAAGLAVPLLVRRRAAFSLLCLLGLALGLVALNFALFLKGNRFALAWPLLVLLPAGGVAVVWQLVAEFRAARRMRRLFSSYVTERVLAQLIANPAMAQPGGERRELTILFADIRGFTSFSERHPPEEVVGTLNEYLEAMTDVVFRWEGTVDKFIGDTILAFWGAPLPQEDHAERALRCALHLCARLDRLNAAWAAAGRPALEIGIGITTGQVLVGNIGAEGKKMDYTVIGDQVNVCSRVEELTKEFGARILVTASTFARLRPLLAAAGVGHVAFEMLAAVAVKGKEEPVSVYRVTPLQHGAPTSVEEFGGPAPGA